MRTLLTYIVVGAALVIGSPAAMAADEEIVTVEINKGTMVKLDRAAASVVISDPNTADIEVVSPRLVFVRGKKIGETTLYAVDALDQTILSAVVDVTHNISNLEREVKRIAPDADVSFHTVDGGMVMNGFAATVDESEKIKTVASTFMGASDKIVNMVKTNGSDQVMLKVKIVEMKRSDLKTLGMNLQDVA